MTYYQIVETDNHGSDYPNEKFVNIPLATDKYDLQKIADAINNIFCTSEDATRFWKVVERGYQLQPGFEP